MGLNPRLRDFIVPKIKFAITSSVATALDYGLYLMFTLWIGMNESVSHAISYSAGMVANFLLQRWFIFETNRKIGVVFSLSVTFSLIGWVLSQAIFNALIFLFDFFSTYDLLAKIVVTATIFLYNFYTKRFSFEKKLPWKR
jgi:putative flippase GtrA